MAEVKTAYTQEQATLWLSRLARGMQRHGQTVFQIEQLQPSWLSERRKVSTYGLASRFVDSFLAALGAGCLVTGLDLFSDSRVSAVGFTFFVLTASWFAALALFFADRTLIKSTTGSISQPIKEYAKTFLRRIVRILLYSLLLGIFYSPILFSSAFFSSVCWGTSIVFGILRGSLHGESLRTGATDISTVERVAWSPRGALAAIGVLFLLMAISSIQLITGLGCITSLIILPFVPLIFGAFITLPLFGAFRVVLWEGKVSSNAGIKTSLGTAFAVSSKLAAAVTVAIFCALGLTNTGGELATEVGASLLFGLGYGFLAFAWYGGIDVLRHYILRFLLSRKGYIPWGLPAFLNFCTDELHVLQQVGGGYMFLHRYLLEYFAGLDEGTEGKPATPQELPKAVAS